MLLRSSRTTIIRVLGACIALLPACGSDHEDLLGGGGSGGAPGGPCTSSAECSGATPVCDELSKVCVQCLFDTQCAAGLRCESSTCVKVSSCTSSLDCAQSPATGVCDPAKGLCVECVSFTDCTGTADCIQNRCVPYAMCSSSLDCPKGLVCDPVQARCVKCVADADCPEGESCIANACKKVVECQSDNQCTPQGKLCDKSLGYCVDCVGDAGCPDAWHCEAGECVLDVCEAGAAKCVSDAVSVCSADGASWGAPQQCPAGTVCKSEGNQAGCAATGSCTPGAVYCQGSELRQCDAQGVSSQLIATCMQGQICDAPSMSCKSQACTPLQAVCQGNVSVVCNADGTGYLPGGTDCAAQGKTCQAGSCVGGGCSNTSPDAVRLVEVYLGTDDYVVLENRGPCAAQIDELSVRFDAVDSANDLDFDLPPRMLNPGERVYVVDPLGAKAGDIAIGSDQNIFFTYDTGSNALLCKGPCYSGQVIDFFSHASGAQPPAPPGGVTFVPAPLTGITKDNENSHAFVRAAFAGAFPAFKASDWSLAPASRPWANDPSCPATQPASNATCTGSETCIYGGVTCTCISFFGWTCM